MLDYTVQHQAEPSIAVNPLDPQNMIVAGFSYGTEGNLPNFALSTYFTFDGGATWQKRNIDMTQDGLDSTEVTQRGDPAVAFGPDGAAYVTYVALGWMAYEGETFLVCAKSTDGGDSYGSAQVILSTGVPDKPYVTTGPRHDQQSGYSVYVAFNEGQGRFLRVARSDDSGQSFQIHPLGSNQSGSFAIPAVDAQGRLYVIWLTIDDFDGQNHIGRIRMGTSPDGASTWSNPVQLASTYVADRYTGLGDNKIPAQPYGINANPCLAVDRRSSGVGGVPGRVYVSYVTRTGKDEAGMSDSDGHDTDVVLQYMDPQGQGTGTWSAPRVVHSTQPNSQFHPWLSLDPASGAVAIAYLDARGDPNNKAVETWVSVSQDGGDTWAERVLSDHPTDQSCNTGGKQAKNYLEYIGAATVEDTVRVVWPAWVEENPDPPCTDDLHLAYTFDKIAVSEFELAAMLEVPGVYARLIDAFGAARAGDEVRLGSSVSAQPTFILRSNVSFTAASPGLTISGPGDLVSVPVRYYGSGLQGLGLTSATGAAVIVELPQTTAPASLRIADCMVSPGTGNPAGIRAGNVASVILDNVTFTTVPDTGLVARGAGTVVSLENCELKGGDVGIAAINATVEGDGVTVTGPTQAMVVATGGNVTLTASTLSGTNCPTGVRASGGTVSLTNSTVQGFTEVGAAATGGTLSLQDVILTGGGASAAGVRLRESKGFGADGKPKNRILRSVLSEGDTAVAATESYVWMDSTTVSGYSSAGVIGSAKYASGEQQPRFVLTNTLLLGSQSDGAGMSLRTEYAASGDHPVSILNNTVADWDSGLVTFATYAQQGEPDPEALFTPTIRRNIVVDIATVGISTVFASGNEVKNNIVFHAGDAFDPDRSGNPEEDPLFCNQAEGQFTLRVDSRGNPKNNPSTYLPIGAFHVACVFDTLVRTSEFAGNGTLDFPGDATVLAGMTLKLGDGTTLRASTGDSQAGGANAAKTELIVEGTLDVNGRAATPVTFTSSAATPAEGDWYGIRVTGGGAALMDTARVEYAVYGAKLDGANASGITGSTFEHNQISDLRFTAVDGSKPVQVEGNTIGVGSGGGIHASTACPGLTVEDNVITGSSGSTEGIYLGSSVGSPVLDGNAISGFTNGDGVRITSGSPTLARNVIDECKYGIHVSGASTALIGVASDTTSDNTLRECLTNGLRCSSSQASPTVRNSRIFGNYVGVYAASGGFPDLGNPSEDGKNSIIKGTSYCVSNRNAASLMAMGNWWGNCGPPDCTFGPVLTGGWLCMQPASTRRRPEVVASPIQPATVLLVRGAWPNPTEGGTDVAFTLDGTGDVGAEVFDVSGRLVRTLERARFGPGEQRLRWDGRDGSGRSVGTGIYFVRLTGNEKLRGTAKVLVAR